ncbi:LPS-assembly lipoprotein LptE [Sessilibacter sp. MAH2]
MKPIQLILIILFMATLSACGWHLRGSVALPETLQTISLTQQNIDPVLSQTIRRNFEANNIQFATLEYASYALTLSDQKEERRVSAVSSDGLAERISLSISVNFLLQDKEGLTIGKPSVITVSRSYGFDRQNVAGKNAEEQLVKTELRNELAQQILRRYRFVALNRENDPQEESAPVETLNPANASQ